MQLQQLRSQVACLRQAAFFCLYLFSFMIAEVWRSAAEIMAVFSCTAEIMAFLSCTLHQRRQEITES